MPPASRVGAVEATEAVEAKDSSDVLFSFRPQPTFSSTFSFLLGALLVAIVVFAVIGFSRDGRLSLLLISVGSGVALVALLYGLTLLVDRAQSSAHLQVRSDGTLTFRNAVGRVRSIELRGALSVTARNLKGAPTRASIPSTRPRRIGSGPTLGPKLTQVRIRDRSGKKLYFVMSGEIPRKELDRFYEIADAFMQLERTEDSSV